MTKEEELNGVFGWSVKGGEVVRPRHNFPKAVKERADYFLDMIEDGMTFVGLMDCIFADTKPDGYDFGATKDWLPKSKEFREWEYRDSLPSNFDQCEIAVYLIYGDTGSVEE
ncbi:MULTISPECIES: hypothetical protein [Streptococcus]|uniref:Gp24 n=1 Tax=Streptococcus dysgalactiae subsp. equisimilis TaxID=119602 RepID=A0AAE9U4U1_STREQ|nr:MULTISPECIES: hypothetical protein [Streptococcus]MDV6022193.1 hypothetical protein [Streptococcus canis]VTT17429.1 gp24 [Streptococcus dysgalactiae]VTT23336.1 gp24 [Streptococcus dysgalactiae subsp. equisimilis]HEQ3639612.1 hypothetical protein [Streptococcus pyogenes]